MKKVYGFTLIINNKRSLTTLTVNKFLISLLLIVKDLVTSFLLFLIRLELF